jgi:uncharacterized membrane protein YfcA
VTLLPESSHFAAVFADPRFYALLAITLLSGVVRGFSGFGSALIFIPLASAVYGPKIAAASFVLIDFFCTIPLGVRAYPLSNRREVFPLTIATALTIPLGAMILLYVDPVSVRWFIAVLVLGLLAVLVSGWRYRKTASLPLTVGVGLASGISGGATTLTGPFAIVYWLGSASGPATVRANLIVFFLFTDGLVAAVYWAQGLYTAETVALALLIAAPFLAALALGARWFHGASQLTYRRVAYAIVAASALVSLPVFDGLLR